MSKTIVYEQPLNERVRAFLRLERLFQQFAWHSRNGSQWNNPIAVNAIIELMAVTTRSDVKLEVHKELERQHSRLQSLAQRPQVDHQQLDTLLNNLQQRMDDIRSTSSPLGKALRDDELLNAIRQKPSLPGCICDFDLPVYKFWLTRDQKAQGQKMQQWYQAFSQLDRCVQLILDVMRHSAEPSDEIAANGFFQQSLDTSVTTQMLRIHIDRQADSYPEISAGKHRFSVRFMQNDDPSQRPVQCQQDIRFALQMCQL